MKVVLARPFGPAAGPLDMDQVPAKGDTVELIDGWWEVRQVIWTPEREQPFEVRVQLRRFDDSGVDGNQGGKERSR